MKVVSSVRATPHQSGRRIDLHWKNPAAPAFAPHSFTGVKVVRKERTFPETPADGDLVLDGRVSDGTLRSDLSDQGLSPLTTYYYTLFTLDSSGAFHTGDGCRVSAFATASHHLPERYYRLLPAVHQKLDRPLRPDEIAGLPAFVQAALAALPPELAGKGPLRRLLQALLEPLDLARSFAEGLPQVQQASIARPEFLLPLARSLGWELDRTLPVYRQRNEIRDAPPQYREVGTIPNLRSIVNRYARWYTQVAELDERIARATAVPMLNVYSVALDGGVWRGADDAAPFLGFGAGNELATGGGGPPETAAELVGNLNEPFHLRPGMELVLSTDGRAPSRVRFHRGDFADIAQASAAEVASVLGRLLPEVRCAVLGTRLAVRSHTLGLKSTLEVQSLASSLVTLEGAPRGRIATFTDTQGRRRIFYHANDPLAEAEKWEAASSQHAGGQGGGAAAASFTAPLRPSGQIRTKVFRGGEWGPSLPFPSDEGAVVGEPAATALAGGVVFVAWVVNPGTGLSRLRYRLGTVRLPTPARLRGRRSGPFPVRPGMRLLLHRGDPTPLGFELVPQDFVNPQSPTSAEVVTALSARLPGVAVSLAVDGTLQLATVATGGTAHINLDLRASSAALALGFEEENHSANGDWGDEIDWQAATDMPIGVAPPGDATTARHYADLQAITDTNGNVRLFWACHQAGTFRTFTARRVGAAWVGAITLSVSAGGGCREPFALMDASGRVWAFWSRREGVGTSDDRWTLRYRRLLFAGTDIWLAEPANPVLPLTASDRQPAALRIGTLFQLFFQSNRTGSSDVWSITFDPATGLVVPPGIPTVMLIGPAADHVPTPLVLPDGRVGMLYRSDRGFDLARAATRHFPVTEGRVTFPAETPTLPERPPSFRTEDSGTLRRFSGSTSVVTADLSRLDRMRQWDDVLAYTPQGVMGEPLGDSDLYSRGTVGLFLSPIISADPLTPDMIERLREVLTRFLPINVRAVVILAPRVDIEKLYDPVDIFEDYYDDHPDIDYYVGPTDSSAVELPGWSFLLSNTPGHVSWNPAQPSSLFHRVFYEPPQ